jgi:hypothetical protein
MPTENPTPAKPNEQNLQYILSHLYILHYREGLNPGLTKVFFHDGNLESARARSVLHCARMPSHRIIYVKPFIHNLDLEEQRVSNSTALAQHPDILKKEELKDVSRSV